MGCWGTDSCSILIGETMDCCFSILDGASETDETDSSCFAAAKCCMSFLLGEVNLASMM